MISIKCPSRFKAALLSLAERRVADVVIGPNDDPYLLRWYLIPRNPVFNVYLHWFMRSDPTEVLHDHAWSSVSWILHGHYFEHTKLPHYQCEQKAADHLKKFQEGDVIIRLSGKVPHRILINRQVPCVTLFVTGPRYREWGFHCPRGWVPWFKFVDSERPGLTGKGCDQ